MLIFIDNIFEHTFENKYGRLIKTIKYLIHIIISK